MIELRPLSVSDVAAHNAGEDSDTIRWLTGQAGTECSTRDHFLRLNDNARRGVGKRGFGIWLDDALAGYVDFDPDSIDVPHVGDVNLAYTVHPWARGRGVATSAVSLVCDFLTKERIGIRALIRVDAENRASVQVAKNNGFWFESSTATQRSDGSPSTLISFVRRLRSTN